MSLRRYPYQLPIFILAVIGTVLYVLDFAYTRIQNFVNFFTDSYTDTTFKVYSVISLITGICFLAGMIVICLYLLSGYPDPSKRFLLVIGCALITASLLQSIILPILFRYVNIFLVFNTLELLIWIVCTVMLAMNKFGKIILMIAAGYGITYQLIAGILDTIEYPEIKYILLTLLAIVSCFCFFGALIFFAATNPLSGSRPTVMSYEQAEAALRQLTCDFGTGKISYDEYERRKKQILTHL